MKKIFTTLIISAVLSGYSSTKDKKAFTISDTASCSSFTIDISEGKSISIIENQIDTLYLVVVDTSFDYYLLHVTMYALPKKYNMSIDTIGRYFNSSKNLIALPNTDKNEIYAGIYFPRRLPSDEIDNPVPEKLILEYLSS